MTSSRGAIVDWSALPWEPMRQGIGRKVFPAMGAKLQLARLRRATRFAPTSIRMSR